MPQAFRAENGTALFFTDERALAAQVIMTGVDARGSLSASERERLRRIPAGAVMLFRRNLDMGAAEIVRMNAEIARLIAESGSVPPFIAVDHEGGAVYRFSGGIARLPAPLSYWEQAASGGEAAALETLFRDAYEAAGALYGLGFTMNLAPVSEPLTPENGAFLGSRAYGPDSDFAGKAAAAFTQAMAARGISCVLKHFPGNTGVDPHHALPVWQADEKTLREAVSPFARAIREASPAAVMVAHTVVPAWDARRPASLSPAVMRRLRQDFGFDGLIIADDFSMGAVSDGGGEKAVEALAAGADMVMAWPANLPRVHGAILKALETGELSRARLREAAARVIRAKETAGITRRSF